MLQKGDGEEPSPDALYDVGTIGIVRQMARGPQGLNVIVEGMARARVERATIEGGIIRAKLALAPEQVQKTVEVDAYVRRIQELVDRALTLTSGLAPEIRQLVAGIDDPMRLAYLLGTMLDLKAEEKQQLLEADPLPKKLELVHSLLTREVSVLELKGKIESQAQQEMTDAQKQYYLRQQMKAIQEELGEGEGNEIKELRTRLAAASLPDHVRTVAEREIDRLARMGPASPEYQMIRTYFDWVLELPWLTVTEDRLDPVEARRVLDEDHYDLDKVKERIVEYLAVRKLKGDMKGPILCFVGPPGVGKTSLGQSIARAMQRKFVRISLGGVRDEAEIRGHRRTYIGSMPGRIIQALKQAGSANPVFMLDELDKVSVGYQGDPAAALLEVLDPAQNNSFRDHYLEVPFDLSKVLFIATANQIGPVHPALRDRMELVWLSGYTEEEKANIARRYLIPRQLSEHGLAADAVNITDEALRIVIGEHTREAGVRNLERQLGTIARKVAARVATGAIAGDGHRRSGRRGELSGPGALQERNRLPDVAARRGHRRRVDGDRRRRAVHRGQPAAGRPREHHPHRTTRRGDAGIGARRRESHPRQRARTRRRAELPGTSRSARARARGRHPQGRTVRRRHDGNRHPVRRARGSGERRRGDDWRDHPQRPRPAGRRHPGKGAGREAIRSQHLYSPGAERTGPEGAAAGTS